MKKLFFAIVSIAIMLSSCIKEGGPQGPSGPMGPSGPAGRDGVQMSTYYIDIKPNHWETDGFQGYPEFYCYAEIPLGGLTLQVIEEGAVLVYFIEEYDNQLPYITPFQSGGISYMRVIRYDLQPGVLSLIVEDSDFKTPVPPFGVNTVSIKVVIIK